MNESTQESSNTSMIHIIIGIGVVAMVGWVLWILTHCSSCH